MEVQWRKSSFSEHSDGNCLELASHRGGVLLRESDEPDVVLTVNPATLRSLVAGAKQGQFDRSHSATGH
ncbi:DUF397 domain-containing protein [Streptomyces lycii]|uniref:DUF397 domain-containing protein n=2 Tax=Streptomyces lycii TaxID=2654337 RepID=A0ABQ7FQK9_9ACTN|nr:DUF397 domain-containing protein [Streptomyces lycii]